MVAEFSASAELFKWLGNLEQAALAQLRAAVLGCMAGEHWVSLPSFAASEVHLDQLAVERGRLDEVRSRACYQRARQDQETGPRRLPWWTPWFVVGDPTARLSASRRSDDT
jgi:hypothetical protein